MKGVFNYMLKSIKLHHFLPEIHSGFTRLY